MRDQYDLIINAVNSTIKHNWYAKMHSIRWDDLQYVLTVANEGSVAAAARALGVNHSTVLRRLSNFEYRHKLRVFHKLPTGYKLTAEGKQLLDAALVIETTVKNLERRVFGQEMKLEGTLRLTTTDTLLRLILERHLVSFHQAYPNIKLELNITTRLLDLNQLDADVAIRPAVTMPENLSGIRICDLAFGVYGSPNYISSLHGPRPIESAHWLGLTLDINNGSVARQIDSIIHPYNIVLKADSFEALALAAEGGMGLAYMPCFVGESSEKLQRIYTGLEDSNVGLWLMTHGDLVNSARVRAFFEFIETEIKSDHNRLAGVFD